MFVGNLAYSISLGINGAGFHEHQRPIQKKSHIFYSWALLIDPGQVDNLSLDASGANKSSIIQNISRWMTRSNFLAIIPLLLNALARTWVVKNKADLGNYWAGRWCMWLWRSQDISSSFPVLFSSPRLAQLTFKHTHACWFCPHFQAYGRLLILSR